MAAVEDARASSPARDRRRETGDGTSRGPRPRDAKCEIESPGDEVIAKMFSGNNTVEYPTQWALNPGAYQNVSNERVDWAALAQQWIQMKESHPASLPSASSSGSGSGSATAPQTGRARIPQTSRASPVPPVGEEGGEAPMEVEGNESDAPPAPTVSPQQWKNANEGTSWTNSWDQWNNSNRPEWGWQSNSTTKNSQISGETSCIGAYASTDPNYSGFNNSNQSGYRPGYWSTDETVDPAAGNVPLNDNIDDSRGPRRTFRQPLHTTPPEVDTTQTIDAAKRRQLPAWIREGLEKMEREKQKQVEREREKKDREEFLKYKKLEEEQTAQPKTDDSIPKLPTKSKFDTDSDNSDSESKTVKAKKDTPRDCIVVPAPILKTKEEMMQEIMLSVRRSLTEILLEVTNEQILSVCQEELSRKRSQPQATHGASMASKSQALSSIGGQLGLGIYENSSGESDSENESEEGRRSSTPSERRRKASDITDGQLQETIKRRKAEFEKTTREIEAQIALEELGHKNDHKVVSERDRLSKSSRGMGDSESDGEDSSTHIRNEQNSIKQKKNSEGTPPLDTIKKTLTDANADKFHTRTKIRHSEGGNKSSDDYHKTNSKYDKYHASKKNKSDRYKKSRSSKSKFHDESSAKSSDSDSESDSSMKKSDNGLKKRSSSTSDSSSNMSSNSSYSSGSSVRTSKKRKKRKESSDESNKSKKMKKDKTKFKDKKEKKNKHSKYSPKSSYTSNNLESQSKSKEYKEEYSSRDSSMRKSYTRTPERKSYKSRYSERSRSRSEDRSHHGHENHDRYYSSSRDKYKMKDRRDRSRDDRERLRDDKDWQRDDRDRSRERKDRRDRDKRSDRDYKSSRTNRY